jgi:biopolymer transport protein ExbD
MTFRTNCRITKGRIDPAPMVDVVFLLLIFIILSSPFVLQTGQKVELPTDPQPPDVTFQTMVVTVSRDNQLFFNGQPAAFEGLRESLARAAQQERNAVLIVKADRQVTHETITRIFSIAREAGIKDVNLATRPEMPDTSLLK